FTTEIHRLGVRLPPFNATTVVKELTAPVPRPVDLQFDNGLGGFTRDGKEYVIYLNQEVWTPAPWVNVIANENFGCLVSESGGGGTWALNSGENRVTGWKNDPVSDPPSEALYFRDEETAEVWSPTPLSIRGEAPYLVRHGAGYTSFAHNSHGLAQELKIYVAPEEPVKFYALKVKNVWNRPRRITVTFYAEWVLGVNRENSMQYIIPDYDPGCQALFAANRYNTEFGERVAFLGASRKLHGMTTDRKEFLGRLGDLSSPAALKRIGLANSVRPGNDPCGALQIHLDIPAGGVERFHFVLGQGEDRRHAQSLVEKYQRPDAAGQAWEAAREKWERILETVQVETPDPAMNLLLNRWLLYQTLSCRIWGRSAFYQSSGAYGFRDQLQDVLAAMFADPLTTRGHILRAARHQFEAGDVLHWWHPPSGRGVRTRFSDDLLWLPYVTAHYALATGDFDILDEEIPFLIGALLEPDQDERYDQYSPSSQLYSLFEHCQRAIEKGSTQGAHGIPLMGSGDWNDGMNRVGIHGRGESIWLGWFLMDVLDAFAQVCERTGRQELAGRYRQRAQVYGQAIETHAWDGQWYLRAFYDDGTALGSQQNLECQIDAIAQTWAVISGKGDPQRQSMAMAAVMERLVRKEDGLILLFTPPFDHTLKDPGYIKGYLPGIRENGGQYTHAALWTVWALAQQGQGDKAGELFRLLSPIYHADTAEKVERYKVEPYVIAADVYGVAPHTGRGGWTWYTGSSGWMYRLGIEAILGVRRNPHGFTVEPCIPREWPGYQVTYRPGKGQFHIRVENPDAVQCGVKAVWLDGELLTSPVIPVTGDGGEHHVRILMGPDPGVLAQ
ncbi:MAG: hypothetical protein VB089_20155, partial [Anaerolineaceae bacterium]|nr:hypothetical protein [Anaerolineaceae bacterium]